MFYWSHGQTRLVLSDAEEDGLVREVAIDLAESVDYKVSREKRREIEQRIFGWLERRLKENPEEFYRKYVWRIARRPDAALLLKLLFAGYWNWTGTAHLGRHLDDHSGGGLEAASNLRSNLDGLRYDWSQEVIEISILTRRRWPWPSVRVATLLRIPIEQIRKVAGTVDEFFVETEDSIIRFGDGPVEILMGLGEKDGVNRPGIAGDSIP